MSNCAYPSINDCPFAAHDDCPFTECPGTETPPAPLTSFWVAECMDADCQEHNEPYYASEVSTDEGSALVRTLHINEALQFADEEAVNMWCDSQHKLTGSLYVGVQHNVDCDDMDPGTFGCP